MFLENVVRWINVLAIIHYWLVLKVILVKTVIYSFIWNVLDHSVGRIITITIAVMIVWLDKNLR